jgi:hypothetical protein
MSGSTTSGSNSPRISSSLAVRPLDELIPRLGQIDASDDLVEGSERERKRAQLAFERVEASNLGDVGRTCTTSGY